MKKQAESVTYIGFVQDHSGSMQRNKTLAVDNFNEQRASLLKEDDDAIDTLVTIVEFDDEIHCNIENMPIDQIKELKDWWTGGMTALYDAIGFCIRTIKAKINRDERKDKAALIIIQTDGAENSSSDFKGEEGRKSIKRMIDELDATDNWSFVFLGENLDKKIAMDLGVVADNLMTHDSRNTSCAYGATTQGLTNYMKSRKIGKTKTKSFYKDTLSSVKPNSIWSQENTNDNNN